MSNVVLSGIPKREDGPFANLSEPGPSDWSVALPLRAPMRESDLTMRIAAICHIFHIDAAAEIARLLRHIPSGFDLFISTDTDEKRTALSRSFSDWNRGGIEIRVMPNRGRDIAPKLVGFAEVYSRHDVVLHLHSKASTHHDDLANWRPFLFQHLIGSEAIVRSILTLFARRPDIGMIGPQHFEVVRQWLGWSGNYHITQGLAGRMGVALGIGDRIEFPSGSMFWARTSALRPLIDLGLTFEDFPEEAGQKDETPAHAIERLFYLSAERAGMTWIKVAVPALFKNTPGIVELQDFGALDLLAPPFSRRLTKPVSEARP